jgi:hypothetical protein
MNAQRVITALEHIIVARDRLRLAWQLMHEEVPEIAQALIPAGALLTAILQSIKDAVAARRSTLDAYEPPPEVIAEWARTCRCCPACGHPPCPGCCAGGVCDAMPCHCNPDGDRDV